MNNGLMQYVIQYVIRVNIKLHCVWVGRLTPFGTIYLSTQTLRCFCVHFFLSTTVPSMAEG